MIDRDRNRSIALIEYPLLAVKVGDDLRGNGLGGKDVVSRFEVGNFRCIDVLLRSS